MVKVKAPVKPTVAPERVLTLFAQNLEEMRRWYRDSSTPGVEAGILVVQELVLANISLALELAMRGETWEKPLSPPS